MTKVMTPQQIDKAVQNFRGMLEKHAGKFPAKVVQAVLGSTQFSAAQFQLFRDQVEMRSKILIRDFTLEPTTTGMGAIRATGRKFYGDKKVVANMPRATLTSGQIHFFQTGCYTPVGELESETIRRGLKLVDPHTLASFNRENPEFADIYPNATQWVDADGKFCYATFRRWLDGRGVGVSRDGLDWRDDWWFACLSMEL